MTIENFFQQLREQTKKNFTDTPIYQMQKRLGKQWNYSVCGTPIQNKKGILMGINWGADENNEAQLVMPDGKDIATYKFIKRSKKYLETYLQLNLDTVDFNYANLCFFRSPGEKDLMNEDYKQSLPLFKQYVEFIKPPWIFSLGESNTKRLQQLGELKSCKEIPDSQSKFKGIIGNLWGVPYFSVPHPNARVKAKSRDEIWKGVGAEFGKL